MERIIILPAVQKGKILLQEIDDDLNDGVIIIYCENTVIGSVVPLDNDAYRLFTIDKCTDYSSLTLLIEDNIHIYTFKYITND